MSGSEVIAKEAISRNMRKENFQPHHKHSLILRQQH